MSNIRSAAKSVGTIVLDLSELFLLHRNANKEQRESVATYMKNYEDENGEVRTPEQWKLFYTGAKSRLLG